MKALDRMRLSVCANSAPPAAVLKNRRVQIAEKQPKFGFAKGGKAMWQWKKWWEVGGDRQASSARATLLSRSN